MIQMKLTIDSLILLRPVEVRIVLPYSLLLKNAPYKHVWLLHPMSFSGDFFFEQLSITRFADTYNCAFIAPSLGNDFFLNQNKTLQTQFLQEELFPHLLEILPFSKEKKDTFLLGISMGAVAALEWSLQSCFFSATALLSGIYDYALPPHALLKKQREQLALQMLFKTKIFPLALQVRPNFMTEISAQTLFKNAKHLDTYFHFYCGKEDYLAIDSTQICFEKAKELSINCSLDMDTGGHNALYWQLIIENAIQKFMVNV